jgi:hypothetical protein
MCRKQTPGEPAFKNGAGNFCSPCKRVSDDWEYRNQYHETINLYRIDYDDLEPMRRTGETSRKIGVFVAGDGLTALGKMSEWLAKQSPIKIYSASNGEIYPQFRPKNK